MLLIGPYAHTVLPQIAVRSSVSSVVAVLRGLFWDRVRVAKKQGAWNGLPEEHVRREICRLGVVRSASPTPRSVEAEEGPDFSCGRRYGDQMQEASVTVLRLFLIVCHSTETGDLK